MVVLKTRVLNVKRLKSNSLFLKLKKPHNFKYKAGQFVLIKINNKKKPFSIASHPSTKNLEFLIKIHPEGEITPLLSKLKKNSVLEIEGPFGMYEVKDTPSKEIIFIAAGTGVSPFKAMIEDALKRFPDKKITLIFGFREDYYFEKEWKRMKSKFSNFRLYICSTGNIKMHGLKKGRVTEHIVEIIKNAGLKDVYICGMEAMIDSVKKILINKLKFKKENIHVEEW